MSIPPSAILLARQSYHLTALLALPTLQALQELLTDFTFPTTDALPSSLAQAFVENQTQLRDLTATLFLVQQYGTEPKDKHRELAHRLLELVYDAFPFSYKCTYDPTLHTWVRRRRVGGTWVHHTVEHLYTTASALVHAVATTFRTPRPEDTAPRVCLLALAKALQLTDSSWSLPDVLLPVFDHEAEFIVVPRVEAVTTTTTSEARAHHEGRSARVPVRTCRSARFGTESRARRKEADEARRAAGRAARVARLRGVDGGVGRE
jgi:hypothetical protein